MFLVTNVRSLNENELSETKGKRQPLRGAKNAANRLMADTVMFEPEDDSNSDAEDLSDPLKEENKANHEPIKLGPQNYACPFCSKTMPRDGHMKRHITTHTGEKPYVCDTCGAAFNDKGNLRRHKKIHTGERPFSCNFCGKAFIQKVLLQSHVKNNHSKM